MESIKQVLLQSLTQSHVWHWAVTNEAAHTTLGEYYEQATPIIDDIIETMIGCQMLDRNTKMCDISIYPLKSMEEVCIYFQRLKEVVVECRGEPAVDNKIDDLLTLISTTLYKLTLT